MVLCDGPLIGIGLMDTPKFGIVAALEREIEPLVRDWAGVERTHDGKTLKFFEKGDVVLVCGGIGPGPARRATEAMISLYRLHHLQSVGYAGALREGTKVGAVICPARVIDMNDGSSVTIDRGDGILLSASRVISAQEKSKLGSAYQANAVDMEAAAVAKGAHAKGIPFSAMKVISDDYAFNMPSTEMFVTPEGRFLSWRFALFALLRPWLWAAVVQLARNSRKATVNLCEAIEEELREQTQQVRQPA
jgi:adenosylhomocysteine nucleosidase